MRAVGALFLLFDGFTIDGVRKEKERLTAAINLVHLYNFYLHQHTIFGDTLLLLQDEWMRKRVSPKLED